MAEKYSFNGYDEETGRGIYESNFPKGTPKAAKSERILHLIQDVWSEHPIKLVVKNDDGSTHTIEAQFDPTYSAVEGERTDASKLMGGNRHGTASEQRVTLDLADDYYQIASEAQYNYSRDEVGKDSPTHRGVKEWHYFINDILFQEYGEKEAAPYRVTVNVKERSDGSFVYSFNAERQGERPNTRQTLHADVTRTEEDTSNVRPFGTSIPKTGEAVNGKSTVAAPGQEAENRARVNRAAQVLGRQGASAAAEFYDGAQDPAEYYGAFSAYYHAGMTGQDMGRVQRRYAASLNRAQQQAAYLAGQVDAAQSLTGEKNAASFASAAGTESGLVYDDFVRQAVESRREGATGGVYLSKRIVNQINAVAKALGVRVQFVDSVRGGKANAQISGHTILVERNNPNPVRFIIGHELTHRMQELAPEQYRAFRDNVMQAEGSRDAVEAVMELYARNGEQLSMEQAMDEVAADYAGALLDGGDRAGAGAVEGERPEAGAAETDRRCTAAVQYG